MWLVPLTLVLGSAGLHASWNLIVKSQDDKLVSGWFTGLMPALVLTPVLFFTGFPSPEVWPILAASGCLQALYMIALTQAYSHGDFSMVYPVARGLAPLLVGLGAPLLLGERLSFLATIGIALIGGGIAWLGLSTRRSRGGFLALVWATVTASCIASYSVIDKVGVSKAHPLAYIITLFWCMTAFMTPVMLWQRGLKGLDNLWRRRWPVLMTAGLMSLGAYLLVLIAMRLTQVSYVAALREISVVFAALLGSLVLREPYGRRRVAASAVVAIGLILLVLAMRG